MRHSSFLNFAGGVSLAGVRGICMAHQQKADGLQVFPVISARTAPGRDRAIRGLVYLAAVPFTAPAPASASQPRREKSQ